MSADLVLKTLLVVVWRSKRRQRAIIYRDRGSQYTSQDWLAFLESSNLEWSVSLRGNCHHNAAEVSFFQLLKREWIKRRNYTGRDRVRADTFDNIEYFIIRSGGIDLMSRNHRWATRSFTKSGWRESRKMGGSSVLPQGFL